jgi:hypothetical protein
MSNSQISNIGDILKNIFSSFRDILVYVFNGVFFLISISLIDGYYGKGVIQSKLLEINSNITILLILSYVLGRIIISFYFVKILIFKDNDSETNLIKEEVEIFKNHPLVHEHFLERYNNNYLFLECLAYTLFFIFIFGFTEISLSKRNIIKHSHLTVYSCILIISTFSVYKNFKSCYKEFKKRLEKINI